MCGGSSVAERLSDMQEIGGSIPPPRTIRQRGAIGRRARLKSGMLEVQILSLPPESEDNMRALTEKPVRLDPVRLADFEREYAEEFDRRYQEHKRKEREAERKLRDFVID